MNTDKKVFEKLFSGEKVELASQKYEFAKKATAILSDIKKADDTLRKAEAKIEAIYLTYKKAYTEFLGAIDMAVRASDLSEKDLLAIMDGLTALGLDAKDAQKIEGFTAAADLGTKIKQMAPSARNLYPKP
jgi:hypothetical protein